MKQELAGRRSILRLCAQALGYEVLLLGILQSLDRSCDMLIGHQDARIAVTLNLQCGHLQRTDAKREDVNGGRQCGYTQKKTYGKTLRIEP